MRNLICSTLFAGIFAASAAHAFELTSPDVHQVESGQAAGAGGCLAGFDWLHAQVKLQILCHRIHRKTRKKTQTCEGIGFVFRLYFSVFFRGFCGKKDFGFLPCFPCASVAN
jgi:hypothetical protein